MFGDHGLCGLLEEGAHGKSPKCLGGNLGDFGEFCKGLGLYASGACGDSTVNYLRKLSREVLAWVKAVALYS